MDFEYELPKWFQDLLPQPKLPVLLKYIDGRYYAHAPVEREYPDNSLSEPFDTLNEAYKCRDRGEHVEFHESLPEVSNGSGIMPGMISTDSSSGLGFSAMLISSTEEDHLMLLKSAWNGWRSGVQRYFDNPSNFLMSYDFIDGHPALWTRKDRSLQDPFDWNMSGHAMNLWSLPQYSEDSPTGVTFMMECGPSTSSSNYLYHSHDLRLDVWEESYEAAIIKTAALLHKFFDLEGLEREGVDYEKSALEVELDERMSHVTELLSQNKKSD